MKKIIALVFFFLYSLAVAQPSGILDGYRFETSNRAGGKIILTTNKCIIGGQEIRGAFSGYSYTPEGSARQGCWTFMDDLAHMVWSDGQKSIYDLDTFNMVTPRRVNPSNRPGETPNGNL
jgi:hypothetical protein